MNEKEIAGVCEILKTSLANMEKMESENKLKAALIAAKGYFRAIKQLIELDVDINSLDCIPDSIFDLIIEHHTKIGNLEDKLTIKEKNIVANYRFTTELESIIATHAAKRYSKHESEKTIDKQLSPEQQTLIDTLEEALFNVALELNVDDEEFNVLINPLIEHMNAFKQTHDLDVFKANYQKTLDETQYGRPEAVAGESNKSSSFYIKLHDAIISLFRTFFRLFDYMASALTGASKLMCETETPFAKKITGKLHFFEYYQAPSIIPPPVQSTSADVLIRLKKDFSEGLSDLENLIPSPAPILS